MTSKEIYILNCMMAPAANPRDDDVEVNEIDKIGKNRKRFCLKVPTDHGDVDAVDKELDLQCTSEEKIKSLRGEDAFMYYSIPGIRKATMYCKDVDYTNIEAMCSGQVRRRRNGITNKKAKKSTVTRSRRISFEADPLAIMEEYLQIMNLSVEEMP